MGSAIAKLAFIPPNQEQSRRVLSQLRSGHTVEFLTSSDGTKISFMRFVPSKGFLGTGSASSKYTIMLTHGNAEDLATSYQSYQHLADTLNAEVFAVDYPGYAMSEGTCSEEGAVLAAEALLHHILYKVRVAPERLILMGRSLGSGVATEMAFRTRNIGGLILVAPLKSCAHVAGSAAAFFAYPFDLFANIRKISKVVDYPVIFLHGDRDEVVPYSHGVALFEEARQVNKHASFVELRGAGHNDIETIQGRLFYDSLRDFIANAETRRAELQRTLADKKEEEEESSFSCMSSSSSVRT